MAGYSFFGVLGASPSCHLTPLGMGSPEAAAVEFELPETSEAPMPMGTPDSNGCLQHDGVLGASPSCHAMREFKRKLIVAVSSAFAAQARSFPDTHGEIQPIRGKKRALHLSPQWCKEVAIDKVKDGEAKSAYASGRLVGGIKRIGTYKDATTACMSRYAWNLPKEFSNEFQLNCAFDASWKSRRDMVSMIVWGPTTRMAGWAPHQE